MPHPPRFEQLTADAKTRIKEISATDAYEQQKQGVLIIDTREADEFAAGHAVGAIHLSKGVVELKIEPTVPDTATPVICYCGGGYRSALVVDNLQKMGYTNVQSLAGGYKAWKAAGLPVE
ncbi:rhodanese-like domain-containing protein [Anatilimnocola floriformis]|uniref:rhodanese-like domain-containing protein n=1 Tax=Anatilimnocola floriformis TaxID=2948575 RepID=UPI0020C45604|nr:rhodanese-like domain-containing protein [Anatilimnocola floriformis]